MQLTCLAPVTAKVTCDGQLAYEGELQTGDLRSEKCQGELKITMGEQLALTVRRGSGTKQLPAPDPSEANKVPGHAQVEPPPVVPPPGDPR